jgi:hypothetical protein
VYLQTKLTRPLPTCELLLAEADIDSFSNQIELALFYEAKLVLT